MGIELNGFGSSLHFACDARNGTQEMGERDKGTQGLPGPGCMLHKEVACNCAAFLQTLSMPLSIPLSIPYYFSTRCCPRSVAVPSPCPRGSAAQVQPLRPDVYITICLSEAGSRAEWTSLSLGHFPTRPCAHKQNTHECANLPHPPAFHISFTDMIAHVSMPGWPLIS